MQFFEFHFNPNPKSEKIFDSFCYEPINVEEKRLGNLYIVEEMSNHSQDSRQFLNSLASHVKNEYYLSFNKSPETALSKGLKRANAFLQDELQKGNTEWMGNLKLAILSLSPIFQEVKKQKKDDYKFNFTKCGDIKILLKRGQSFIDLCSNLIINEIEPYPLKVFSNIVSGKLSKNDLIFVQSPEVYEAFLKERVFDQLAGFSNSQDIHGKGGLGEALEKCLVKKEETLSKISGVSLLINLTDEIKEKERVPFIIKQKKSLLKRFSSLTKKIKSAPNLLPEKVWPPQRLFGAILKALPQNFLPAKKPTKTSALSANKPVLAAKSPASASKKFDFQFFQKISQNPKKYFISFKKNFSRLRALEKNDLLNLFIIPFKIIARQKYAKLSLLLVLVLAFGFFLSKTESKGKLALAKEELAKIETSFDSAKNNIALGNENEVNISLQESWVKILPLTEPKSPVAKQAALLRQKLEESLFSLNKLEKIAEPKIFADFKAEKFWPQRIIYLQDSVYAFNYFSPALLQVREREPIKTFALPQNADSGAVFESKLLFFRKPNVLMLADNGGFRELVKLQPPSQIFSFEDFSLFNSNIYFKEKESGQIIKYDYFGFETWGGPVAWLAPQANKSPDPVSMTVSGSIWLLNKNGVLDRYFAGSFMDSKKINIFPAMAEPLKISTAVSLSYLYILDPNNKRIVILDKSGNTVKQYQSEKFNALKDAAISDDGAKIYLLNEDKIYLIEQSL